MHVGQQSQLKWQVKEKCGNRVVKVILERIQVSGSGHNPNNESHETCSSPKIFLINQDQSLRNAASRPFSESSPSTGLGHSRPQRKKIKTYTHYFDVANDSGDDEATENGASFFDSELEDTLDSQQSPLNKKNKIKAKNSKKTSTNLNHGSKIHQSKLKKKHSEEDKKTEPKVTCSVCNKNLIRRHLKRHFQRKHPKAKLPTLSYKTFKIECDFCPLNVTKWYMWAHLQKKHPEQLITDDQQRRVKCDLCPSVFFPEELFAHKKTQHPDNKKVKVKITTNPSLQLQCDLLQCDLCSGKYKTQLALETHILNFHVVDKPFECDICFKSYLTKERFQKHIKKVHEAKDLSSCRWCPTKSFTDAASIQKHIETVHKSYRGHCVPESANNNVMCPVCDTCFVTESDFVKHLKTPQLKSVMKCKLCSEPVYTPCRLNTHLQKKHSAALNTEASTNLGKLNKTIVEPSVGEPEDTNSEKITEIPASVKTQVSSNKFFCVVCSAYFSRRCDLDLHELREKHSRWKCPICAKLLGTKGDLKSHIEFVHSNAKPFHCTHEGCCSTFKSSHDLKTHAVNHDPDRVRCKECFKYFTKKALSLHVANYHTADQALKCDVCGRTCGTLNRLKKHLLTHTDERPYPCKFCDVRYKCAAVANRHMKKCQFLSEDQRKKFVTWSSMIVQSAKKRKPRNCISGSRKTSTVKAVERSETLAPEAQSTCTNELASDPTSLNGNETDLESVTQEVDLKYFGDNSLMKLVDQPGPEESIVKFEIISKQEICANSD